MQAVRLHGNEIHDGLNLAREVFFAEGNMGLSRSAAQAFLEFLSGHGEELAWFGVYEGDLKGVLAYDPDTYHISLLFVRKEDRGHKISSHLLDALIAQAALDEKQRITVHALPQAVSFYEHMKFEANGEEEKAGDVVFRSMEYLRGKEVLGRKVKVIVDHSYGTMHPTLPDVVFTANYGYVEPDINDDCDFQNAYIYGVKEPVDSFTGYVIGVIYHRHETATRWIVAKGLLYDKQDVIDSIGEIEQAYDTRFEWL